jgi:hypothetical protein
MLRRLNLIDIKKKNQPTSMWHGTNKCRIMLIKLVLYLVVEIITIVCSLMGL